MDFAALMSAQLAKSQKKTSSRTPDTTAPIATSKYLKRSEIEAARQAAYLAEQAAREKERIERSEKKRKFEEESLERERERETKRQRLAEESKIRRIEEEEKKEKERRKRLGLPELPKDDQDGAKDYTPLGEGEEDMPEEELTSKIRAFEEPARLFGETHKQRLRRLQRLQNPQSKLLTSYSDPTDPIPTTLEPVPEADMKVPATLPSASDKAARLFLARQLVSWFTLILRAWAQALASRPDATKITFLGQQATSSMTQAVAHLTPLYRKLEKLSSTPSELPDDLLEPMVEIVRAAQERRYVDANDGYLRLSIGNAAWPIGVTMVGIHERSAREKLHESDKGKAHIMSDEATRKILQSIKRCLSFAQTSWPPEDMGQLMG